MVLDSLLSIVVYISSFQELTVVDCVSLPVLYCVWYPWQQGTGQTRPGKVTESSGCSGVGVLGGGE